MIGQLLGTTIGGIAGSVIPGVGTGIGAGIGAGIGGGIEGMIKGNQADKLGAPLEDPEQRDMLNQIQRKKRQLEVGTSPEYQYISDIIGKNLAQTQKNVQTVGGGVGTTLQGFQAAQRTAGDATNRLAALQSQQVGVFTQLAATQLDKIASRKMDLQMWEKLQKMRESAELKKTAMGNIMGGLASVLPTSVLPTSGLQTMQTRGAEELPEEEIIPRLPFINR